jgi:hypothetical protein
VLGGSWLSRPMGKERANCGKSKVLKWHCSTGGGFPFGQRNWLAVELDCFVMTLHLVSHEL